jgi:hypothetical protein
LLNLRKLLINFDAECLKGARSRMDLLPWATILLLDKLGELPCPMKRSLLTDSCSNALGKAARFFSISGDDVDKLLL